MAAILSRPQWVNSMKQMLDDKMQCGWLIDFNVYVLSNEITNK